MWEGVSGCECGRVSVSVSVKVSVMISVSVSVSVRGEVTIDARNKVYSIRFIEQTNLFLRTTLDVAIHELSRSLPLRPASSKWRLGLYQK